MLETYFNPKIIYIKGIDDTVADAISHLEYDPSVNVKIVHWSGRWCYFTILLAHYDPRDPPQTHGGETSVHNETFAHSKERDVCDISHIYVTLGKEEEEIYPPTIAQIAEEQRRSREYMPNFKSKIPKKTKLDRQISLKVIDDTEILV